MRAGHESAMSNRRAGREPDTRRTRANNEPDTGRTQTLAWIELSTVARVALKTRVPLVCTCQVECSHASGALQGNA